MSRSGWIAAWLAVGALAVGPRLWSALAGPLMWGYDAWGHIAYVMFIDLYRAAPWADQGWSYFHPPLHYGIGWVLAQFGSGDVLVRGLALWGGFASLVTAALAAALVKIVTPERPALVLLGFGAVALLPAHLFMSPMPGNEMTLTMLSCAAVVAFIAFERSHVPNWIADSAVGGLLGLALLTKFSGLIPLVVVVATLGVRPVLERRSDLVGHRSVRSAWLRAARRSLWITAVALAVAAPYYARNIEHFGTPFQLSREFALVSAVEQHQPPGERHLGDYFRFSPQMFSDPNPLKPHLLNSIWGTVYLDIWTEIFRESDVERALVAERKTALSSTLMALAGLFPTGLALFGAAGAVRDIARGRRREVYVPIVLLAGATVGAFCIFAWQVPIWSALKASYLLGLSMPYAVFLARGMESLSPRRTESLSPGRKESLSGLDARQSRFVVVAGCALIGGLWLASAILSLEGVAAQRRADAPATGAVRFYFGEYAEARRVYGRLVSGAAYKVPWLDNLAAVELAEGHAARAQRLYARAVSIAPGDPYRVGRLAVATAMAGDRAAALKLLDDALSAREIPELLANRAAIALDSDPIRASSDLQRALVSAPEMVPAWLNLAAAARRSTDPADAQTAQAAMREAARRACLGPRSYPYGVGTGEVLEWGVGRRWLLLSEEGRLHTALPSWYRGACERLRAASHFVRVLPEQTKRDA